MKNVTHPNMFPVAGSAAAAGTVAEQSDGVDCTSSTEGAPATPGSPWANPLGKLQHLQEPSASGKRISRSDQAIAFLREHGPSTSGEICKGLGITSAGGITPFITVAFKDGRIKRAAGKYFVGDSPAESPEKAEAAVAPAADPATTPPPAATPPPAIHATPAPAAKAAAAIAAMRQPIAAPTPDAVAHFDAATAIVAKRKPSAAPAPAPQAASRAPTGRKPEFVVFVDDVQLLAWPNGDLTLQTEYSAIELKVQHFRALIALAKLRE